MKTKTKSYRLATLIRIADLAYAGPWDNMPGPVALYHKEPQKDFGDKLAEFIARELYYTFVPHDPAAVQLRDAAEFIGKARAQLEDVECAFKEKLRKLCEKKNRKSSRSRVKSST